MFFPKVPKYGTEIPISNESFWESTEIPKPNARFQVPNIDTAGTKKYRIPALL